MSILSGVIIAFTVLETLNILILYFTPGTRKGNGIGIFNAYEKSKKDPEVHALINYLINWVAGTKLIFVALLIVILITGNSTTQLYSAIALILSISTFFWRLYPAIRRMDASGQVSPRGYSKNLALMILVIVLAFIGALIIHFAWSEIPKVIPHDAESSLSHWGGASSSSTENVDPTVASYLMTAFFAFIFFIAFFVWRSIRKEHKNRK